MRSLRTDLDRFIKDERGSMTAEMLILFPILIFGFISLIVYWDVFRTQNVAQKANYSISDLLARQETVNEKFVADLHKVLLYLMPNAPAARMRITSFEFREGPVADLDPATWGSDDAYVVLWSRVTGGDTSIPQYVSADLVGMNITTIPMMDNLQGAILVETWVDWVPRFDIGVLNAVPSLAAQTNYNSVVTFARRRRVCMAGTSTCA